MFTQLRGTGRAGIAAATAVLLTITACGTGEETAEQAASPAAEDSPTATSPTPDDGDGEPAPSGPQELVVGAGEDAYDREEPEANIGMYPVNGNIFETLVRMTPDYEVKPLLATEWEFVEPNTWRFHLREGVTFHDGTPLTAQDVKYSMDRIAEAGGGTIRIDKDSTEVVDDHTVEITPTEQNRRLVQQLVHPENSIIKAGTKVAEQRVGTGPFREVDYTRQQELVVERYEDYWGETATLERITFRFIPDRNARRLALEGGDVQAALELGRSEAGPVEQAGFEVATTPVGAYEAFYLNIDPERTHPALLDAKVRQAIGRAIDRQALVTQVFEGLAAQEQTMIPARLLGDAASTVQGFTHDKEEARRLLEEAGWTPGEDGVRQKDGQDLNLTLINGFPSSQVHGAVPEFLQAQLKEVGIALEIFTAPDRATYTDRLKAGDGDLWLEQGSQNDANPAFLPALLFWEEGIFGHTNYQPLFAPGWPEGEEERVGDGSFDRLVEEALATPDPAELKAKTAEAMHLLIDQHAIVIPLAGMQDVHAHAPRLHGFEAHPSTIQIRWDDAFLTAGE